MKGIILAGGVGSRLYPASVSVPKPLLPIYDKPMIYYPITTLIQAGIKDILIIIAPNTLDGLKQILGDGSNLGLNIQYVVQPKRKGIADALVLGADFIGDDDVTLILGDNIFYGKDLDAKLKKIVQKNNGATVFAYHVNNPKNFGVIEFDRRKKVISLEEKPLSPRSNYAAVGLYVYDNKVVEYAKNLKPSDRGELEITDINNIYLKQDKLSVEILPENYSWFDAGTFDILFNATNFVHSYEEKTGEKIGCIEEAALKENFVSREKLQKNINPNLKNEYLEYLQRL